jgi:hypothetical protein
MRFRWTEHGRRRPRGVTVAAFLAGGLIATAATATASHLITGHDIKNGTITAKDLSRSLRRQIARAGRSGPQGALGPQGVQGPSGAALLARARGTITGQPTNSPVTVDVPMTGTTWTQQAGESVIVTGTIGSSGLPCAGVQRFATIVTAFLDGRETPLIGDQDAGLIPSTPTTRSFLLGVVPAQDAATTHSLGFKLRYACSNLPTDFMFAFDVVSAR